MGFQLNKENSKPVLKKEVKLKNMLNLLKL